MTATDIFDPREAKLIVARDEAAIKKRGLLTEEHPISTKDGLRLFMTRRVTVLGDDGNPQYLIKTHEDVTDRRQTELRMAHMAYHDGLTDLPNRTAFLKALSQMIEACQGTDEEFAVLSRRSRSIQGGQRRLRPRGGDELLLEVARRMQAPRAALRGPARRRRVRRDHRRRAACRRQRDGRTAAEALAPRIPVEGKSVRTGLSIGIALFPGRWRRCPHRCSPTPTPRSIRAKAKARGSIRFFEAEMDQRLRERRALQQELRTAIEHGELSLHYQPQARTIGGEIIGFEALVRWQHPTRGLVSPGDFIPLAEESGLIVAMGEWILREACREAASWPNPLQIAVNLSPVQFRTATCRRSCIRCCWKPGLPPAGSNLRSPKAC